VSGAVLGSEDHAGIDFEPIGEIALKGVKAPVELHRALAR